MKPILLTLSLLAFTSLEVKASQSTLCADDKSEVACQAYITGLVEGYVASKQNYLPKQPVFESKLMERAFAYRVGNNYSTLNNKEPACLPSVVDTSKIVAHLINLQGEQELTAQLGDYLRANYNCEQSANNPK